MSESRWWGLPDSERLVHSTPDEAIEEILDQASCPLADYGEVVVVGYANVEPVWKAASILEDFLDRLDEEYGDPDGDITEPTEAMKQAADAFVRAVLAEYQTWVCEPTGEQVRVDALKWAQEHRPDWLSAQESKP